MSKYANVETGCRLVGEFVYQAELPAEFALGGGEVVRPRIVGEYVFVAGENTREFTVLLRDGRTVKVRGHGLKQLSPTGTEESGSYGIFARDAGEEVLIALFKIPEVVGIFDGDIGADRQIA